MISVDGYEYDMMFTVDGLITVDNKAPKRNDIKKRPRKIYPVKTSNIYSYNGPVYQFGKCVCMNFKAETTATSKAKAIQNIIYRAKKSLGVAAYAGGFTLGYDVELVE